MKCFLAACLLYLVQNTNAQDACCSVVGINPSTSLITVRNNTTGKLFMFRASQADLQTIKMNDAVSTNNSFTYVTAINQSPKQYFAGPVNFLQQKDNSSIGLVGIDYKNTCCIITAWGNPIVAQNLATGNLFSISSSNEFASALKPGNGIYTATINNAEYAVIQTTPAGQEGSSIYVLPVDNEQRSSVTTPKWEMNRIEFREGLGRLSTDFPDDVEWGIDIYTSAGQKLTRNRLIRDKQLFFPMKPGNYSFKLNLVDIPYVPISVGNETRIKAGVLSVTTKKEWLLRDTNRKLILRGEGDKKLALPVGNYILSIEDMVYPVQIQDKQTSTLPG